jgi:hypothetical protein
MSATRKEIQLALRRPLLDYVQSLPQTVQRAWEGKSFSPTPGQPYVSDSLIPSGASLVGHSRIRGRITLDGLYVIQWYGLPRQGLAVGETADAIVALYPPGTSVVTADGNAVQVKTEPAPWSGQVRPVDGASVVTITVPYQCVTIAPVAA